MPEFTFANLLIGWGPLGIFAVYAFMGWHRKDKQLTKERLRWEAVRAEERQQWDIERRALEERLLTKSETWVSKYHEFANGMVPLVKELKEMAQNTLFLPSHDNEDDDQPK